MQAPSSPVTCTGWVGSRIWLGKSFRPREVGPRRDKGPQVEVQQRKGEGGGARGSGERPIVARLGTPRAVGVQTALPLTRSTARSADVPSRGLRAAAGSHASPQTEFRHAATSPRELSGKGTPGGPDRCARPALPGACSQGGAHGRLCRTRGPLCTGLRPAWRSAPPRAGGGTRGPARLRVGPGTAPPPSAPKLLLSLWGSCQTLAAGRRRLLRALPGRVGTVTAPPPRLRFCSSSASAARLLGPPPGLPLPALRLRSESGTGAQDPWEQGGPTAGAETLGRGRLDQLDFCPPGQPASPGTLRDLEKERQMCTEGAVRSCRRADGEGSRVQQP